MSLHVFSQRATRGRPQVALDVEQVLGAAAQRAAEVGDGAIGGIGTIGLEKIPDVGLVQPGDQ